MDVKIIISVQLSITRENGKIILGMLGQCEGEYKKLALCMIEQKIDKTARKVGAQMLDRRGLVEPHQFYREFVFPNEEKKDEFLKELQEEQ